MLHMLSCLAPESANPPETEMLGIASLVRLKHSLLPTTRPQTRHNQLSMLLPAMDQK